MLRKNWHFYLVLIGISFLLYANCLRNGFISDDISAILENPAISNPLNFWAAPSDFLNSLCFLVSRDNAFLYHLVNVLLHSANSVLVFLFLRLFFNPALSFLAACLFVAHPVHAEAVAWVSARPYLILTLFILTTFLLYHRATGRLKLNLLPYLAALAIFCYFSLKDLGLFLLLPAFLVLFDLSFGLWRKRWKLWLPFILLTALIFIFTRGLIAFRVYDLARTSGADSPLLNPLVKFALVTISHAAILLFPANLTFYHEPTALKYISFNFSIFFLLAVMLLLLYALRRSRLLFFAGALFILSLAPVYSPLPFASCLTAERYLYFPSISLSLLAALMLEKALAAKPRLARISLVSGFIGLLIVYAALTILRNADWRAPEVFWRKAIAVSPRSPQGYNELGLVYYRNKDPERALAYFKQALAVDPNYAKAYTNIGNICKDKGRVEEADSYYRQAIKLNPYFTEAQNNLANIYVESGRYREAQDLYNKVLQINPRDIDAYYNLGSLYAASGDLFAAAAYFKKALANNPLDARALNNLGIIYLRQNLPSEAEAVFKKAIQVNRAYAPAYFNLSVFYARTGKEALADKYRARARALGYFQ
jgi:tetratricopeptide (TPR) repeat protein